MTHNILCVTDLDGTFVKNSIQIHPEDLKAYEKLSAYSDFAIATGRSVKEITYIAERNHLNVVCAIGYNGAVVTEKDQVVFSKTLPPTDVDNLLKYLKEESITFDALDNQERVGNFNHEDKRRLWNMPILCMDNLYENVRQRCLYKFNLRPEADKAATYVQELKARFPNLEFFQSGSTRIEVTAKGVSKGSGLELLKRHYQPVIAFGDSGNDISMFEVADISYCMSHAPEVVKEAATYVVDNFADAVTHLENLLDL